MKPNSLDVIDTIIDCLSPDLLKPEYINKNKINPLHGHCYVATEAFYHFMAEEEKKEFSPAIIKVGNITHWFLINDDNDQVIDLTSQQFNFKLDYSKSRKCGFLTKKPSKRCLILINRVYEKSGN